MTLICFANFINVSVQLLYLCHSSEKEVQPLWTKFLVPLLSKKKIISLISQSYTQQVTAHVLYHSYDGQAHPSPRIIDCTIFAGITPQTEMKIFVFYLKFVHIYRLLVDIIYVYNFSFSIYSLRQFKLFKIQNYATKGRQVFLSLLT
jgi:hypothetical protein